MRKSKLNQFVVGAMVIVSAIGYLIYTGIRQTSVYYLTVSEVYAKGVSYHGEGMRVEGSVVEGSIKKDFSGLKAEFAISDGTDHRLPVAYKGIIPDMFRDGIDVVVEGRIDGDGVFQAHTLLTSCPSKYEAYKKEEQPA
jgi:cytochrome c-type biogenesis protein CcmE